MIPSRGLQWSSQAIGLSRRRAGVLSTRQFSSSNVQHRQLRASPLLFSTASTAFKSATRSQPLNTIQLLRNGTGVRFASTTPSTIAATPSIANSLPEAATASQGGLTSSLESFSDVDLQSITNMPEQIGYLKALGLDYGYGPTATMEWLLEHTHVYAGTPWWLSIALTITLLRAVFFWPSVVAAQNNARLVLVKPQIDPWQKQMSEAARSGDQMALLEARTKMNHIYAAADVSKLKMMTPMVQPILGFGSFFILRAMANLPVPAMATGGVLWFHNLTIPDPYFILPMLTAFSAHWLFRMGGESGQMTISPQMQKALMYGLPTLSLLCTWWLPAAVQLSFFVSAMLGFGQALFFRNPTIRGWLKMPPLNPPVLTTPSPYRGNMKVAAPTITRSVARPRALSTTELNSRFQASNAPVAPEVVEPKAPTTAKELLVNKLKTQFSGVEEFRRDMIKSGKKKIDERVEKATKREKEQYEKKRADQLKELNMGKHQQRRAERAARRAAK